MKEEPPKDAKTVIGINFEPAVIRELDRLAAQVDRSRSWMVNQALKEKLGIVDTSLFPDAAE